MALDMGEVIDGSLEQGTLTADGFDPSRMGRGDAVWHHEWCRSARGTLACLMLAGLGKVYVHDLDDKTLVVHTLPVSLEDLGLTVMGI